MGPRDQKIRWGDTLDDEDALPSNVVRGPDEHGIKTVVEFYKNDKGEAIKKVTKLKVTNVEKKVYEVATQRRQEWKRFGQAARETAQDNMTGQAPEEIPLELTRQQKATDGKKTADMSSILASADKTTIVGSLKDVLAKKKMERDLLRARGLLKEAEKPPEEDGPGRPGGAPGAGLTAPKPGSYVPPSFRNRQGGGEGESMQKRREENSLRVTNLSEDVTEQDLRELFQPFGHISRVFLARDRETSENRGFAFVNFTVRQDAERALRTLDGYGYDNLILRVEWAAPREQRN